jgi:hypothetical protein
MELLDKLVLKALRDHKVLKELRVLTEQQAHKVQLEMWELQVLKDYKE